jgi:hypothetical protein
VAVPYPTSKTIVSVIGRLSRKFQGHEENSNKKKRKRKRDGESEGEREKFGERSIGFGMEVGRPCPLQKLRHLLGIVHPYEARTRAPNGVRHRPYKDNH